jgi:hypothetical protein
MTETVTKGAAIHSLYAHPQPAGLCALREYLLTNTDEGKLLLLRFAKEGDFTVDSMTFEITMLDAMGGELGKLPVTLRDSEIPPVETGHVFTPDVGIPVDGSCADIRLRLITVTSGDYTYRVEGGTVTTDYTPAEPWHYDPRAGESERLTEERGVRVRSKASGKVRHLWPIALLTALILLGIIAAPFLEAFIKLIL